MVQNRGIIGHVEWKDGTPAANLHIDLLEKDFIVHDLLPSGYTDKNGDFIISYHPEIYTIKGPLAEKPDIELTIKYIDPNNQEKTFQKFFKNVKEEWLKVDLKLDDESGSPHPESQLPPVGICSRVVNLKDSINLEDIESNDIWEICSATSTGFSRGRYEKIMKLTTWGGRVIVGDIFEGPLTRNEKNLNSKGIKSLNARKNKPKAIKLNFIWLDENNNIIHTIDLENQDMNFLNEKGLRILLRELDKDCKKYIIRPVEQTKMKTEVRIKNKQFNFEVICLESLSRLKELISSPPFK
ncbi:MAG: hypothetical protein ACTSO9_13295 [Candidatus Helarchaeota archaeon]